jgi:hypothetical protein
VKLGMDSEATIYELSRRIQHLEALVKNQEQHAD